MIVIVEVVRLLSHFGKLRREASCFLFVYSHVRFEDCGEQRREETREKIHIYIHLSYHSYCLVSSLSTGGFLKIGGKGSVFGFHLGSGVDNAKVLAVMMRMSENGNRKRGDQDQVVKLNARKRT